MPTPQPSPPPRPRSAAAGPAMRVLRLCSVFEAPPAVLLGRGSRFDPIGGMQNHTACLTRALDARGVHQDVVTTRPPGAPARQRLGDHATVHRLGLPVRAARQFYALPAAVRLARLAAGADILHAHLGEDLAVVPLAFSTARRHGIPVVLTVHMSLRHTFVAEGPRSRILKALGGALERHGARAAAGVIVLTPRLEQLLRADGVRAGDVHVVPSGVVPADFARGDDGRPLSAFARPRVVYVGRLARQKGVQTLVEAAARLRTDASVVLVGDGPERRTLERAARRLGVEHRVSFLGFRPHQDIPGILAAADVLVLPSLYEELGSVLVEGMQAGAAIVASRAGGIPDALGGAGQLVDPGDPVQLASAVDALLADPARAHALRARARRRARAFDWDVLAERVAGIYGDVLGDARRPAGRAVLAPPSPPRRATVGQPSVPEPAALEP